MLEQRVAPVLGGLDHQAVVLGSQRQPVRPADPVAEEQVDGAGHLSRVTGRRLPELRLLVWRASSIPVITPGQPWNTATFSATAISCAATSSGRRSVSSAPRSASRSSARERAKSARNSTRGRTRR